MRLAFLTIILASIAFLPSSALAQANPNRNFFNTGGVGLFNPIIDVVNSGSRLVVQPTVSADRKYVTISGQFQNTQLVAIQNFPFFTGGFTGPVGGPIAGIAPGAAAAALAVPNANISAPVNVKTPGRGSILSQTGMIRLP
jgi:hypothetical protein